MAFDGETESIYFSFSMMSYLNALQKVNITREQMATILCCYIKYKGYDVSVGEDTNILYYTDAKSISEYAVVAMRSCGAGIMEGDAGKLMPTDGAQHCQVAAILHRFCENVIK